MSDTFASAELAKLAKSRGERREVLLEGRRTAYWFYPAKAKVAKTAPLVMIHGYRGNHHGLEAIAGAITSFDVYIPDLPGFGKSEPLNGQHTIENYANWVNQFLTALKLKRKPHLLGHSFGSIIVSAYAARFDGIESLILENPVAAPALQGPKAFMTLLAKFFFALAGAAPEAVGTAVLKGMPMVRGMSILMTKSRNRHLRRWIHSQHDQNFNDFANRKVALEGYSASISNCVSDFAPKFTVPVLMLTGQLDDITTPKQQAQLFELLPVSGCQMTEFENVGHLTHYEIPAAIAESIGEWVTTSNG